MKEVDGEPAEDFPVDYHDDPELEKPVYRWRIAAITKITVLTLGNHGHDLGIKYQD